MELTKLAQDLEHLWPLSKNLTMDLGKIKYQSSFGGEHIGTPSPAFAIVLQSSPRVSIRSRYKALALSNAETASYSFFFSINLDRAAADADED